MKNNEKNNTDRLLELYYSGRLDAESKEIVQGWLSDGGNREIDANTAALFARIVRANPKPDRYTRRSLAALQKELGFTGAGTRTVRIRRAVFGIAAGAAAAAAVFLAAVFLLPSFPGSGQPDAVAEIIVTTGPDAVKEITLPDGSTVKLRAGTTLAHSADFAVNRKVRLDGEAYFVVVRDAQHPFTAVSRGAGVTVLGTEFNMRSFDAEDFAEVILASGSVRVVSGGAEATLNPSERAVIDKTRNTIALDGIDRGSLSRLAGKSLSLVDISLGEALRMIGGYYNKTIVIEGDLPHIDGIVVKLGEGAALQEALYMLRTVVPVFDFSIDAGEVAITIRTAQQ